MNDDYYNMLTYQYELAHETIESLKDPKDPNKLDNFADSLRNQCMEDIEILEISDIAIAIHNQVLFLEDIPLIGWVNDKIVPDFEELRNYIKAKKDTAQWIRDVYRNHSEKLFYAIVLTYQIQMNINFYDHNEVNLSELEEINHEEIGEYDE